MRKTLISSLAWMHPHSVEQLVRELPVTSLVSVGHAIGLGFDGGSRRVLEPAILARVAQLRAIRKSRCRKLERQNKTKLRAYNIDYSIASV